MALITFEDLPSTNTPLNADNLNNNFEELNNKIKTEHIAQQDANNLTETRYSTCSLNANTPTGGTDYGTILVNVASTYINQVFIDINTDKIYHRKKIDNSWTNWREIDNSKTLTFNSEWVTATFALGQGLTLTIPINNPEKKSLNINLTSIEIFSDSSTWLSTYVVDSHVFNTFFTLTLNSTNLPLTIGNSYLVRLTGTISLN